MQKVKEFILQFLDKEAEAWTKKDLGDLEVFNNSVKELYDMATEDMDQAFGILKETDLKKDPNPVIFRPGHLFKLTHYLNDVYEDIWIAYTSYKNPNPDTGVLSRGYIISEINNKLKIIGQMSVELDELYMEPVNWKASVYNPKNLDILHLGKYIKTERYLKPRDNGFPFENYLEDEMTVFPLLKEEDFEGLVGLKKKVEDNKNNRRVIENLIKKGVECEIKWI